MFTVIFSCIGGLIYGLLTVSLHANQNVTGLTLTTFGVGLMRFVGSTMNQDHLTHASRIIRKSFFNCEKLGGFGQIFLSHGFLVYLSLILAVLAGIIINHTRTGLYLRAVGESPKTADAQGINVSGYKYVSILIGSAIAGLGGMYYVLDRSSGTSFVEAPIEAFGWLAVALVIFSMWKPWVGIIGSFIFGGLYVLPLYIPVSAYNIKLVQLFPYIMTVLVLVITSLLDAKNSQPPASLGVNYYREDR